MTKEQQHRQLIEGYLALLHNLPDDDKLEIISRLSLSLKTDRRAQGDKDDCRTEFVAEKSAEELIAELRAARSFNRAEPSFD